MENQSENQTMIMYLKGVVKLPQGKELEFSEPRERDGHIYYNASFFDTGFTLRITPGKPHKNEYKLTAWSKTMGTRKTLYSAFSYHAENSFGRQMGAKINEYIESSMKDQMIKAGIYGFRLVEMIQAKAGSYSYISLFVDRYDIDKLVHPIHCNKRYILPCSSFIGRKAQILYNLLKTGDVCDLQAFQNPNRFAQTELQGFDEDSMSKAIETEIEFLISYVIKNNLFQDNLFGNTIDTISQ
jgi:hypothetical protein